MKKLLFIALIIAGCSDPVVEKGCFVADYEGEEVFVRCVTKEQFHSLKNSRSYEKLENKRFEENCSECQ